jgi:hypothetical protein
MEWDTPQNRLVERRREVEDLSRKRLERIDQLYLETHQKPGPSYSWIVLGSFLAAVIVVFTLTTRKVRDSRSQSNAFVLSGVLDESPDRAHHSRSRESRGGLAAVLNLLKPSRRSRHRHSRSGHHHHSRHSSAHSHSHSHPQRRSRSSSEED